ncbi:MAG TPA: response regulator [Afipia sp.]|uniref:response regulator n=1 Tax=unclassified Afipia TaxID=2642050 RepID=UPI0004659BBA|nr:MULTISPECIES: response regulator [unclassified Afipia]MAH70149.1 response regulator [Afipia sp.]OUX60691.1 MAG: response regulator [Afipia sp. TMED4]HAO40058.1 response regulator [Afipia sp.]HAP09373.1 response regulator [Afipia sp.]HAP47489.1 response regulator [Afipia sp.]|tara:strand:+ start:366 stop:785 length:420 start_codon:yes stop_codon:yes gene_type:complete
MNSIDPPGPAAASPADLPKSDLPRDVLLVEDDPLIAMDSAETITGFGVASVRTARDVAGALKLIAERAPDFALLDVGLNREKSFVVAEQLRRQMIPLAFVTGYSGPASMPPMFKHYPVLRKPYLREDLLAILRRWRDPV